MQENDKIRWRSIFSFRSILFTVFGVFLAVVALKGFMIPNNFLDGGVTGVSILFRGIFNIDISILLVVLNIPFLIIGYKKIGKTFSVHSFLAVLLLAGLMYVIDLPAFTNDKLLIAVFGGFLIGLGIGLVIRGGGVIDGLEVIAHYTHKHSGLSTSEIILTFNTVIIMGAAIEFGIEPAMYSLLVYFTAMKTTDYIVDGFEEYTAMTIISPEYETIKSIIVNDFGKAITVYKGERGYLPGSFELNGETDIVMTIVTRLELHRIKKAVLAVDPNAFVYVQIIKEVKGGLVKMTKSQDIS